MKLKLRKFRSVIVLHVSGVVQAHDVDVLSVGAAKISKVELPLILNLERADLTEDAISNFENLYEKFSKLERILMIVSRLLPAADASTFEEALAKSKNPRKDIILRCLSLEEKLEELETEEEILSDKIKELEAKGKSHFEFLKEKSVSDFMLRAMEESIERERERIQSFRSPTKVSAKDAEQLEALKSEVLALFQEKGVSLS